MAKKNQYDVLKIYGYPVEEDASGRLVLKRDASGAAKEHTWRIGKHTKGKYSQPGQLILTENNLLVMIARVEPMAFKNRHEETPFQRFLTQQAPEELLAEVTNHD